MVLLVGLVFLLLGVVTWLGIVKASTIPGWCDVYKPIEKSLTGKRDILIVFGSDGLGNETKLKEALRNPNTWSLEAFL